MLLELLDIILSLLKVYGLNHSGVKEPKNESMKFSDTLYFKKVKIDGNCANGIILSYFFNQRTHFSQYHTLCHLHQVYTNNNDKTLQTSTAPNACYYADMVPEAAVVALLQKVYYPFPAGNSVNTPGVWGKVSEKSAVSL